MEGNNSLKRAQGMLYIAITVGVFALFASVVKNIVTERWLKEKDMVACIPADTEASHPIVYHQTIQNPIIDDAYIKSFVEEYVHLTQDEQIVDYHQVTSNARYQNARLSQAKWKAIEMSVGTEKALNMEKYYQSNEIFYTLQQGNMGWVFLIDDIILKAVPNSGAVLAVVRGEFQVTYDRVKVDMPPRFWGYREMRFMINQGNETIDSKENELNKYGVYVAWSNVEILTPEQKEARFKRNYDYYLLEEHQMLEAPKDAEREQYNKEKKEKEDKEKKQ